MVAVVTDHAAAVEAAVAAVVSHAPAPANAAAAAHDQEEACKISARAEDPPERKRSDFRGGMPGARGHLRCVTIVRCKTVLRKRATKECV